MQQRRLLDWSKVGQVLTSPEVCVILGICDKTLKKMVKAGEIPHKRLGGRIVRFEKDALRQWLKEGER